MKDVLKVLAIVFFMRFTYTNDYAVYNIASVLMWWFLILSCKKEKKVKQYDSTITFMAIMFHVGCLIALVQDCWFVMLKNADTLNSIGLIWFIGTIVWMLIKRSLLFTVSKKYKMKFLLNKKASFEAGFCFIMI